jgi:hypothetical protein
MQLFVLVSLIAALAAAMPHDLFEEVCFLILPLPPR